MSGFGARMVIVAAVAWSSALVVADEVNLSKVDRSIRREPVWTSGKPQYCLFVISAERRVWFVVDGADLYMDINENGDLTDPGEKLPRLELSFEERREAGGYPTSKESQASRLSPISKSTWIKTLARGQDPSSSISISRIVVASIRVQPSATLPPTRRSCIRLVRTDCA